MYGCGFSCVHLYVRGGQGVVGLCVWCNMRTYWSGFGIMYGVVGVVRLYI